MLAFLVAETKSLTTPGSVDPAEKTNWLGRVAKCLCQRVENLLVEIDIRAWIP